MFTFAIALQIAFNLLATKPETNPDGMLLTMKEATITGSMYPDSFRGFNTTKDNGPYFENQGNIYYINGLDTLCIIKSREGIKFGTFVSRNEFGIDGGLFPSPDYSKLAYYEKDEHKVRSFPLLDISNSELKEIKYPYAGTNSEILNLWVYDHSTGKHTKVKIDDFTEERYLTQVCWVSNEQLLVQVLDRSQHHLRLNLYNSISGEFIKTLLCEDNDAWVEPYEPTHFISDKLFIYSTDNRDGYKNLYLADLEGNIKRLVNTDADIEWAGADSRYIYYTSAEVSPAENHLFRVKVVNRSNALKTKIGKPERLTKESGWHNIKMEDGCYVDRFSSFNKPGLFKVFHNDGRLKETLKVCDDPLKDYACPQMEFGTIPSEDGIFENHYRLIKPIGFDESKKYPLIVYVYGGPHSQLVNNSWLGHIRLWELLMAQRGYVVYVQDNRGTLRHGSSYEKAINRNCGKVEMQDQMKGIKLLMEKPWIDKNRIGVHGWSYGGFMTLTLKLNYPDIFKVAVAGGPVIDWKWYEIMYGERYMDTPQSNPNGYEQTSILNKISSLNGKVLVCQGAIDPVVVWENALSFLQECINLNKQVDFFTFPSAEHNMTGEERVYLYDKITTYFDINL